MNAFKKFVHFYNIFEEVILIAVLAVITLVCFAQVIMRYVFSSAMPWVEEFCMFLMVWSSWLGMSIGQRYGEHIKITVLTDKFSFRLGHIMSIICDVIVIVICVLTTIWGLNMAMTFMGTKYASIPITLGMSYLSVPCGCFLMSLRLIGSIVKTLKELKEGPKEDAPALEEGGAA